MPKREKNKQRKKEKTYQFFTIVAALLCGFACLSLHFIYLRFEAKGEEQGTVQSAQAVLNQIDVQAHRGNYLSHEAQKKKKKSQHKRTNEQITMSDGWRGGAIWF